MMGRTVLIVQARMGSTRLPGKSMMKLAGEPMIARILERLLRCDLPDEVVLAVPDQSQDDVLVDVAKQCGVSVFRGSEHDLVDRYCQAARAYDAELIVRIPADNVTPEPTEVDRIIEHHHTLPGRGFSSNLSEIWGSGYPDGIGAEVFDTSLLVEASKRHNTPLQREHVHRNFFDYETQKAVDSVWAPVSTIQCSSDYCRPDIILDVNTDEQYRLMRSMYDELYPVNSRFTIEDIVAWIDCHRTQT